MNGPYGFGAFVLRQVAGYQRYPDLGSILLIRRIIVILITRREDIR